ncbi:MAG: hypothetical protein K9L17_10795 [Clostridiales bacterium]|nr:hypothetical protein [Clostridiales bacterium]MCF8023168.1 hypothetical protein [Clostridiales bacterium]
MIFTKTVSRACPACMEEEQFQPELEKLTPKEVVAIMEMTTNWYRKGKDYMPCVTFNFVKYFSSFMNSGGFY